MSGSPLTTASDTASGEEPRASDEGVRARNPGLSPGSRRGGPRRLARGIVALGGAVVLLAVVDLGWFALAPVDRLLPQVGPATPPAGDAAAVLFHDFDESGPSGLSREAHRRLSRALTLLVEGRVSHLVACGGYRETGRSGAELMGLELVRRGAPAEKVVVVGSSWDTFGNLAELETLAARRGWRSILLVSSPHHLQRLETIAGDALSWAIPAPWSVRRVDPVPSRRELWVSARYNAVARLLLRALGRPRYDRFTQRYRTWQRRL